MAVDARALGLIGMLVVLRQMNKLEANFLVEVRRWGNSQVTQNRRISFALSQAKHNDKIDRSNWESSTSCSQYKTRDLDCILREARKHKGTKARATSQFFDCFQMLRSRPPKARKFTQV